MTSRMENPRLTKGDLFTANTVLNKRFITIKQWHKDIEVAIEAGLIKFEYCVGGTGQYVPTQKYIELMDVVG